MGRRYTPLSISSDLKVALARLEYMSKVVVQMTNDLDAERVNASDLVRQAREECGLSRAALAERADVSERFVQYIERGERAPSAYALHRIAKALREGAA